MSVHSELFPHPDWFLGRTRSNWRKREPCPFCMAMWTVCAVRRLPSNAANRSLFYIGKRESSAKFESTAITPYASENAQFEPLLVIECRGLEFIDFDPRVRC